MVWEVHRTAGSQRGAPSLAGDERRGPSRNDIKVKF